MTRAERAGYITDLVNDLVKNTKDLNPPDTALLNTILMLLSFILQEVADIADKMGVAE